MCINTYEEKGEGKKLEKVQSQFGVVLCVEFDELNEARIKYFNRNLMLKMLLKLTEKA